MCGTNRILKLNGTFWCYCCRWLHWIVFAIWSCSHHSQPQQMFSHLLASYWFFVMFWMDCRRYQNVKCLEKLQNSHCSSVCNRRVAFLVGSNSILITPTRPILFIFHKAIDRCIWDQFVFSQVQLYSPSKPSGLLLRWKATWRHRNRSDRHSVCWMLVCCSSPCCMRHSVFWAIGNMVRHVTKVWR